MSKLDSLLRGRRKKDKSVKEKVKEKRPSTDVTTKSTAGWSNSFANPTSFSVMDDNLDSATEMAEWFCSGMAREEVKLRAAAILEKGLPGEFMVRDKQGAPHCYALTVKDNDDGFATFLIEKSPDPKKPGYMVRGCGAICKTIAKLIKYYRDEERAELGLQLQNPGPYVKDYVATIYATEREKEMRQQNTVKQTFSKGSLEAKQRSFENELDDDDEEEVAPMYDMANLTTDPDMYAMASPTKSTKSTTTVDYDLAARDDSDTEDGPEYDMAKPTTTTATTTTTTTTTNDGSDQPDETGVYDNVSTQHGLLTQGLVDDIYSVPKQQNDEDEAVYARASDTRTSGDTDAVYEYATNTKDNTNNDNDNDDNDNGNDTHAVYAIAAPEKTVGDNLDTDEYGGFGSDGEINTDFK